MIFILDNYDSFTYNLVQYIGRFEPDLVIKRNDAITVKEIENFKPSGIIISPGPKDPAQAGISKNVIQHFYKEVPIFGVCLGHQAIGEVFGGKVVRADQIMHGKTSPIKHNGKGAFQDLPDNLIATRYHSLIVERSSLPDCLEINAETQDGTIMGLVHKEFDHLWGVQFHPESILTENGIKMIENFYKLCKSKEMNLK